MSHYLVGMWQAGTAIETAEPLELMDREVCYSFMIVDTLWKVYCRRTIHQFLKPFQLGQVLFHHRAGAIHCSWPWNGRTGLTGRTTVCVIGKYL